MNSLVILMDIQGRECVIISSEMYDSELVMMCTTIPDEEGKDVLVHFRLTVEPWFSRTIDTEVRLSARSILAHVGGRILPPSKVVHSRVGLLLQEIEECYGLPKDYTDVLYFVGRIGV